MEAMVQIIQATMNNPQSKVVVFSQWTSFLNIVEAQLKEAGITFARIDGSMKADRRDAAIEALDNDPDTRVLLASLAVCSVGLNLVSADTVILSDSCNSSHLFTCCLQILTKIRVGSSHRRPSHRPSPSSRTDASHKSVSSCHGGFNRGACVGCSKGEA